MITPNQTVEATGEAAVSKGAVRRVLLQSRLQNHRVAIATIALFTVILFAPLLSGRTFSMVGAHMYAQYPWVGIIPPVAPEVGGRGYPQTDQAETFYPLSVFATQAVRSGQLPMWLPYSFGGIPILEMGQTGILYPPRLLIMLFLSPIRQHDLILFIHLLLAGLGMYALLRCWGANAWGAVLGAIVWEINGQNAFWLVFEHVPITAAWLPWTLIAATLAVRRRSIKWAGSAGIALGFATLQGLVQYVFLSGAVLAVLYGSLIIRAARERLQRHRRRDVMVLLALPASSLVVAAAVSAAYWLPLLQSLADVHRQPLTLDAQLSEAIPWNAIAKGAIFPNSAAGPAGKGADFPSFAFVGLPALVLSIMALYRRSAPVWFGTVLCAFSLLLAAGSQPLYSFFRLMVPYFGTMHPFEAFYLFSFAIAVLAAFGMTEVVGRLGEASRRGIFWPAIGSIVIGVEVLQLVLFAWIINPVQPESRDWLFPETPLITALKKMQTDSRVLPVSLRLESGAWTPPVFAGKVTAAFGIRSGSGYESLLPSETALLWRAVENGGIPSADIPPAYRPYFFHDRLPLSLLEKLSVGLLVTPPGVKPKDVSGRDPLADGTLQLVYKGKDGWIYKDARALPRAFLVPSVVSVTNEAAALKTLVNPAFDAGRAAIVVGGLTSQQSAQLRGDDTAPARTEGTTTILKDQLNEVEIETSAPNAEMLVLNDSWDSGWVAYVDDVEEPVIRVDYNSRGLLVPKGSHTIVFSYRPRLLLIGLAISICSLFLLAIVYAWLGLPALQRVARFEPKMLHDRK